MPQASSSSVAYGVTRVDVAKLAFISLFFVAIQFFFFSQTSQVAYVAPQVNTVNSVNATQSLPYAASTDKSLNWSGYVADGGEYTAVSGKWIVPTVTSGSALAAEATWVGIGGVESRNLIQAGTQAVAEVDGTVIYGAWIERLPENSERIPLEVRAKDIVSTSITETTPNKWKIIVRNETTNKSYETELAYVSNRASADWIEEMPSSNVPLTLASFDTVHFLEASATKNGQKLQAKEAGAYPISMVTSEGAKLVETSVLSDASTFRLTRQ